MTPDSKDRAKLCSLLQKAAGKVAVSTNLLYTHYDTGPKMAAFIFECILTIENGALTQKQRMELSAIFAPTSDWDNATGDSELGDSIYVLIRRIWP